MKKLILLALLTVTMTFNVQAQLSKSFYMPNAGVLDTLLKADVRGSVVSLTLSGNINIFDLSLISDMRQLTYLDISATSIQSIGSNYPANEIPNSLFSWNYSLSFVALPNGLTSIGSNAFNGCSLTGSLTIPSSVTSIGDYAFYNCAALTSLILSNKLTSIGESAFGGCSNISGVLTIPNTVSYIGGGAFFGCSNLSGVLIIPNSVSYIGREAFENCTSLTSLILSDKLTSIGSSVFWACSNLSGSLTIPNSVTSIGELAFGLCGFTGNLTIPNTVTSIGDYAFARCRFNGNLILPNSITSIGFGAFGGCSGFNGSLTIPNSVTSIGAGAFSGCSGFNGNLILPNSLNSTSIGKWAFSNCSGFTGSLTIPDNITSIGGSAFKKCSGFNGNLIISNSVDSIKDGTFFECSNITDSITIPASVTSIGDAAFASCWGISSFSVEKGNSNYCSVDGILFDKNQTTLIQYPIAKPLSNYIIPNTVSTIGSYAFYNCFGLNSVTINSGVASIGNVGFYGCSGLKTINCLNNTPAVTGNKAFAGLTSITDVYVPTNDAVNAYKADTNWIQAFPGDIIKTKIINGYIFNVTVPLGTNACYISGAMNPDTFLEMARINATQFTIDINTNTPYGYKYYSGPDLAYVEVDANNNDIPIRSFSSNDIVVKWKSVYSDVKTIKTENIKFISGKSFIRAEFDGNVNVEVYNSNGILIKQANATNNIIVNNLNAGLYIVKINGTAYKVVVE